MNDFSSDYSHIVEQSIIHKDSITIRRPKKYNVKIAVDQELEEIAKIEVDAFLNQGKILTDKNLKQVEKSIKDRWKDKRTATGVRGLGDVQSNQTLNKKCMYSNIYSKTKRD